MNASMDMSGHCDAVGYAVEGVSGLQPYQPGKPIAELEREYGVSDIVKLASNENPLGASPGAIEAMARELPHLWVYPDGSGFELRQALATMHNVPIESVTLGNGSNDVLVLLAETFLAPGREAVFSQYAFAVYPIVTQATGAGAKIVPALAQDAAQPLGHDLDAMAKAVGPDTRIVFVANPNNPTGTWVEAPELRRFVESIPRDVIVVVDEAYFEYAQCLGAPDASQWLADFPNLVVCRTFSKAYGLAGVRAGYCLSSPEVADLLNRIRQPFNMNSLALAGAAAALQDTGFIERSVKINAEGIEQLRQGLQALALDAPPSGGNFLLVDMKQDAAPLNEALLRQGVIVRPVGNYGLAHYLRMTIGTAEQNERLLSALSRALA